jgi:ArsR family transcriptional regulator
LARVLRPERGGIALVVDMVPHTREEYRQSMGHKHLGFPRARVHEMFTAAGLTPPRILDLPGDPEGKGPGLFVAVARREP